MRPFISPPVIHKHRGDPTAKTAPWLKKSGLLSYLVTVTGQGWTSSIC